MTEVAVSSSGNEIAESSGLQFFPPHAGVFGDETEPVARAQDEADGDVDELKLAQSHAAALLRSRVAATNAEEDSLAKKNKVPAGTQAGHEAVAASLGTESSFEEPEALEVVASVAVAYRGLPPRSKARLVTLLNEWACWHHGNALDTDAGNQLLLPIAKQIEVLARSLCGLSRSQCSLDLRQGLIRSAFVPHGMAAWPQQGSLLWKHGHYCYACKFEKSRLLMGEYKEYACTYIVQEASPRDN